MNARCVCGNRRDDDTVARSVAQWASHWQRAIEACGHQYPPNPPFERGGENPCGYSNTLHCHSFPPLSKGGQGGFLPQLYECLWPGFPGIRSPPGARSLHAPCGTLDDFRTIRPAAPSGLPPVILYAWCEEMSVDAHEDRMMRSKYSTGGSGPETSPVGRASITA